MNRDDAISLVSGHLYGSFATMETDEAQAFAEVAIDALREAGALMPEIPEWVEHIEGFRWPQGWHLYLEGDKGKSDPAVWLKSEDGIGPTIPAAIANALEGTDG